jgi:DNA-binding NtrC family response regulator
VDGDPQAQSAYAAIADRLPLTELVVDASTAAAQERFGHESFDALIAALDPPQFDGLALLHYARAHDATIPTILIASAASIETLTASLRAGATDYLTRPLSVDELANSLQRVLAGRRLGDEHALLRRQIERPYSFDEFIGASPAMRKVFDVIQQVAASDVDVLVLGETGTGKELVARSIHGRSLRAERPFVPVDCGAIPDNLLESEFFGHERGAFTGADSRRIGLLEFADGGTLFLDELGELPLALQAKLLRTLQERKIRRVGGREEIPVDVRIVAATSRNLDEMIRQKLFREDLYYRINVVRIDLPPLAERGDDLGLLAERLAWRYSKEMGKPVHGFTPEAFQILQQYRWPGNVRELQNVIRRSIALTRDTLIGINDLPDQVVFAAGDRKSDEGLGFFESRDRHVAKFEREYLDTLLRRHQGNVKTAAKEAGLPRGTLYRLMKNHELDGADFRSQ